MGENRPADPARHPLQGMRPLLSGVDAAKMFQVGQRLTQFINGSGGHSPYWRPPSGIAQRAPSDFLPSCAVVPDRHRTQGRIQTSSFPRRGFTVARGNALESRSQSASARSAHCSSVVHRPLSSRVGGLRNAIAIGEQSETPAALPIGGLCSHALCIRGQSSPK
jgi:hypothetical protein